MNVTLDPMTRYDGNISSSYSESQSSSNPVKSISCTCSIFRAYSKNPRWQNTYWSGVWIENALWLRIFSTVVLISTFPKSSNFLIAMSKVAKVPVLPIPKIINH